MILFFRCFTRCDSFIVHVHSLSAIDLAHSAEPILDQIGIKEDKVFSFLNFIPHPPCVLGDLLLWTGKPVVGYCTKKGRGLYNIPIRIDGYNTFRPIRRCVSMCRVTSSDLQNKRMRGKQE